MGLGVLDAVTDVEVSVGLLYLFPLMAAAYWGGQRAGMLLVVLGSVAWFLADEWHVYATPLARYWDAVAQLVPAAIITWLTGKLSQLLENERLRARRDPLTALWNAQAFRELCEQRLAAAQRSLRASTLAYLDLDNFKSVNDSQGHARGDELLCGFARLLQESLRGQDVIARLGGDEFAVWLDGASGEDARRLLDRVHQAARAYAQTGAFGVGVSIGAVTVTPQANELPPLLIAADNVMYEAKRRGKNTVVIDNTVPLLAGAAS